MSATRDKTQKIAFVYSNLYQIYRQGKEAAKAAPIVPATGLDSGRVLKADDLKAQEFGAVRIEAYKPAELLGKRVPRPESLPIQDSPFKPFIAPAMPDSQNEALKSLKDNLKALNDLHSRLRFMLKELEELVKE